MRHEPSIEPEILVADSMILEQQIFLFHVAISPHIFYKYL